MEQKFTFDDFILVPGYAKEDVREFKDATRANLFGNILNIPILSAPMDTITGIPMMEALWHNGAAGVHHRYCDFSTLKDAAAYHGGVAISPSLGVDKVLKLVNKYLPNNFFVVDVAHGHSKKVLDFCEELIKNGIKNIVSGNIATVQGAEAYLNIGINHLRVGIGGGSRCITRSVTGFGFPQASAIYEIASEFYKYASIISDGGCKNTGDIIKAYASGADFVMTGYLFAGTDECPPPPKGETYKYRGMASEDALGERKKEFFVEGDSIAVEPKGTVLKPLLEIQDAIRHACHYGGVTNYIGLRTVEKRMITSSSYLEGLTRK